MLRDDLPDIVLYLANIAIRQFQTRAGRGLDVNYKLSRIGTREERHTEKWEKGETDDESAHDDEHGPAWGVQHFANCLVVTHQHLVVFAVECGDEPLEAALARMMSHCTVNRLDEPCTEKRHDRHRHQIRRRKSQHYRNRESREQITANTREEHHGEKHYCGGECSRKNRERHFLSAALRCRDRIFAFFHVTEDVFEYNHRVVNDAREHERQAAEHHRVDGPAEGIQKKKCRQHRQRDGQQNGNRATERAEEDEHHRRSKYQSNRDLANDVPDGRLDVLRLIKDHGGNEVLRDIKQLLHAIANTVNDRDGVAVTPLFKNRQVNRFLAVDADDVVLDRCRVLRVPDISKTQHAVTDGFQRHIIHILHIR